MPARAQVGKTAPLKNFVKPKKLVSSDDKLCQSISSKHSETFNSGKEKQLQSLTSPEKVCLYCNQAVESDSVA